ncbi:MAG: pentapeptide repeat-containing protein [bacterium]
MAATKRVSSVPLIMIFEGDRLVDGQLGMGGASNGGMFDALLMRQGLPSANQSLVANNPWMVLGKTWKQNDVPKELSQHTLADVTARNLDLKELDLHGSVITHSDFSGSKLTSANLNDTVWINTICPDGSLSADTHEYTCLGH